jgi:S-adenosylmethionine hydrolase
MFRGANRHALTDFGTADYFVAAVKGVILTANPKARLVDITHEIPPQDIESAAFTLLAACEAFPDGTTHLAVVDPGVGSERRPLLVQLGTQIFRWPRQWDFSATFESASRNPAARQSFFTLLTRTSFDSH